MLAHLAAKQLDRVMDREEVARHVVDSAVAIHTAFGPGLLESVFRRCLVHVIHPVHRAQLLTYLKLSGHSIGFLINWKVPRIKDGIQPMIWREP